jgi:non-ribosomal peptide synthetase component F
VVPFRLTPEVANLLGALSRERGVTLFTTLLAGLFAVLRVATGREDLLIVTPVENRSWPDAERCVGYIANDIVIRVDLAAAPTFEAVLARTWDGLREAWKDEAFSNNSLAHLVHAELGQDPTAFMQVAFFFDEYMRPRPFRSGALEWAPLPLPSRNVTAFRELSLALSRSDDDGIEGALQYKRVAMDDTTASAFAHAYAELMADVATGLTADPSLLAMRSPAGDGHAQLATLQATVDAWQRPLTEVAAAFVLAGAPDVRPLSELRDMVTPPLNVAMRKKG